MNDELTDEKDLELELDSKVYQVTAEYFYSDAYTFGSDADGNRGERNCIDLYECHLLNALEEQEDGTLVEVKDGSVLSKLRRMAEKEAWSITC